MFGSSAYFILLATALIAGSRCSAQCPANSTFKGCPEPLGCRPTCERPNGADACITVCAGSTCVCQEGYVLNSDGKCILPSDCPIYKCPANKEWADCPKPLECRPSCEQPKGAEICIDVCDKATCVCKTGYVLDSNGDCIPEAECPKPCGDNAVWSTCPSLERCRATCERPNGTAFCFLICAPPTCVCKDGYVLDSEGKCVLKAECPKPCGENEVWSTCPKLAGCRATCEKQNGAEVCAAVCAPATCICKDGYVLNSKGKCVEKSRC